MAKEDEDVPREPFTTAPLVTVELTGVLFGVLSIINMLHAEYRVTCDQKRQCDESLIGWGVVMVAVHGALAWLLYFMTWEWEGAESTIRGYVVDGTALALLPTSLTGFISVVVFS
jgi:hypothetical protein